MNLKQLESKIVSGQSMLTGRIQSYKAEQTEKAGCNEKFGVLVGDQVLYFTVWAPKGTAIKDIKRPAFADKLGSTVVVVSEPTIRLVGSYLRTGAASVESVEW